MIAHIPQWVVVAFYWIPLALCAVGYTVRTTKEIKHDLNDRRQSDLLPHGYYYPSVTIGTIAGRLLLTVTPLINIAAFVTDLGIDMIGHALDVIGKTLDCPIVSSRRAK